MLRPTTRSSSDVAAGAQTVALFHHRPDRCDTALDALVDRFSSSSVTVIGASDMLELAL